ncbi:MAG: S9 family peptidase [Melioribacteraceae bacterium]|nr:S9 family peptidase [Melioribacteraceae bacterium]
MRKLFFSILVLSISISTLAQKKELTMEDVVFNSYSKFYKATTPQLSWVPQSEKISFVKKNGLIIESADGKNSSVVLTLDKINNVMGKTGVDSLKRFPSFSWDSESTIRFWNNNKLLKFNIEEKSVEVLVTVPKDGENKTLSGDKLKAAYTIEDNLYLTKNGKEIKITSDGGNGIVNGKSVHRNEFGIEGGIFWSPNSNAIAFYRMDESMVTEYPLIDITKTPAEVVPTRYPMAGQKSHHVQVGVYNIESGNTVWLKTGEPVEQYLTNVTWGPEEKFIYIAILNRDQNNMQLTKFDAATGEKVKVLFEENDEQYVEPEHQLEFLPNNNDKFLWFSERDGFNHLYLYNTDGSLIKQVTKGDWVTLSFEGFDEDTDNIFISATKDSPLENNFYKVNIGDGKITRLTESGSRHRLYINKGENLYIDSYTNASAPRITNIVDESGKVFREIQNEENPLKEFNIGKVEYINFKGEDDIDLYGQIFLPPDFDASKKYPVIVYVYGGPHAQVVTNRFPMGRYDIWALMMAQKGYVIFQMDNRGSANRGLEFEQAIHRQLGTNEIKDQLSGIEYLKSLGYIDENRIGVWGWSYGGFMTTSLMLRTNDVYKVGVAGGTVVDWKYYEVMYGERYMDTPEQNPEGYKNSCLLNHVDKLNGKLLLVHGTEDPTVVIQHVLAFAKKAANINKPLDFFPYVGHGHGVRGKDALHLYNKITNYFLNNL